MEYIGTIGSCSFNDRAEASAGYLLDIPGYLQTTSDTSINEYSQNDVSVGITSPSNMAAATLWGTPRYLHFVNTIKGAWGLTSEVLRGYDNSKGHSLLIFMRFKCATPPTGADTFFFGNAVGNYDSFGLRVRQVGTPFPTGGDGQLVFGTYNDGSSSVYGGQAPVNICDNVEHSICIFISRLDNKIHLFVDGVLTNSQSMASQLFLNTFKSSTHFGIGAVGGNAFINNALACDLRDIKMVYTPNKAKTISEVSSLVNKWHVKPYSTITKDDWGY